MMTIPFEYTFMDENFNRLYEAEQRQGAIFTLFAFIAIFIACLGLFGALDNRKLARVEIDATPAQGGNLATPQAAKNGQQDGNKHSRPLESVDKCDRLRQIVGRHMPGFDFRGAHRIGWIA